ncbi:Uncharacterised protein [Vibrio cholerae]|nr:Uncharacterised protein [Vibrio cholerae]
MAKCSIVYPKSVVLVVMYSSLRRLARCLICVIRLRKSVKMPTSPLKSIYLLRLRTKGHWVTYSKSLD